MTPKFINSFGLVFDIVGVALLFFFGPPTINVTKEGHELLTGCGSSDDVQRNRIRFCRNNLISRIALVLLFFGFIAQLISNYIKV